MFLQLLQHAVKKFRSKCCCVLRCEVVSIHSKPRATVDEQIVELQAFSQLTSGMHYLLLDGVQCTTPAGAPLAWGEGAEGDSCNKVRATWERVSFHPQLLPRNYCPAVRNFLSVRCKSDCLFVAGHECRGREGAGVQIGDCPRMVPGMEQDSKFSLKVISFCGRPLTSVL